MNGFGESPRRNRRRVVTRFAALTLALFVPPTFAAAQPPSGSVQADPALRDGSLRDGLEGGPGMDPAQLAQVVGQFQTQQAGEPEDKRLLRLLAEIADTQKQILAALRQRPEATQPPRGGDIPLDVYRVCYDGGRPYSEGARLTLPAVGSLVCHRIGPVNLSSPEATPLGWERE